jgi:phosphatidylserine/phosphatidylglycerophosphate/cardiolipin synthase-like enzyme
MHDKVAIIDDHIIMTGSFNWSEEANKSNRDNLVVIDNGDWAAGYEQDFQRIWSASKYP